MPIARRPGLHIAEKKVNALTTDSDVEQALEALDAVAFAKQELARLNAELNERIIEWIDENGDIERGDIRWYVGTPPVTKCVNPVAAAESILNFCEGDLDTFCEFFSADAFKAGEFKKRVGQEAFDAAFVVTRGTKVKEGKPVRRVSKANKKFGG